MQLLPFTKPKQLKEEGDFRSTGGVREWRKQQEWIQIQANRNHGQLIQFSGDTSALSSVRQGSYSHLPEEIKMSTQQQAWGWSHLSVNDS